MTNKTKIATIIWPDGGIWYEDSGITDQSYMGTAIAAGESGAIFIGEIVEAMADVECGSGTIMVDGRSIDYAERGGTGESHVVFDFFEIDRDGA